MSTLTNAPTPTLTTSLRRVTAAELVKLRTLRSHGWLLASAVLFTVTLGPVNAVGQVLAGGQEPAGGFAGPLFLALTGTQMATLLLGVLGVLVVTGEYAPRSIRTTFAQVPRRGLVVVARSAALALVTLVAGALSVAVAVTASAAVLARADIHLGLTSPTVARVSLAMVWYLVGWAVLGQVAGWLTRSKIGGASLLFAVMVLLAPVVSLVPGRAGEVVVALLPSSAGAAMIGTSSTAALGSPLVGFLLWTGYLVGGLALSTRFVGRKDA